MTKDEALRMALEALTHGCPPDCKDGMTDSGGVYPWGEPALIPCPNCKAITAIREVLAQPEQEPVAVVSGYYGGQCVILPIDPAQIFNSNTALYTTPQPAVPEQKPLSNLTEDNIPAFPWVSQPAQQQEPVACRDEMCACRGGPCAECPDGEREKELADVRNSRDFYKRRTDELQKAQSQMRDPERTMVCDILANGRLLVPAGGRYSTSPPASKPLTDEEQMIEMVDAAMVATKNIVPRITRSQCQLIIEAAHGITGESK